MKFILGYRTELFIIFLVPIHPLRWYRFLRYSGTGSSAMMVPIRALRWYRLTDTIKRISTVFSKLVSDTNHFIVFVLQLVFQILPVVPVLGIIFVGIPKDTKIQLIHTQSIAN